MILEDVLTGRLADYEVLDDASGHTPLDLAARAGQGHLCLACGAPSRCAYVVATPRAGDRWVDLCHDCCRAAWAALTALARPEPLR